MLGECDDDGALAGATRPIHCTKSRGLAVNGCSAYMFQYKRDFEADFRKPRDVEATRRLNPRLQSFSQWLSANATQIPLQGG